MTFDYPLPWAYLTVLMVNTRLLELQTKLTGCGSLLYGQESRGEAQVDKSEVPRPGRPRMRPSATSLTAESRQAPAELIN